MTGKHLQLLPDTFKVDNFVPTNPTNTALLSNVYTAKGETA